MRSKLIFTLSVLTTIACNPSLRGGTYTIVVTEVVEDSCSMGGDLASYQDEGSVWWEDGETLVLATTSGEWWWHWDGEVFSYDQTTLETWADDCEATWQEDFIGSIVDSNNMVYNQQLQLDLTGFCAGYDKSVLPCTMDVDYAAERTGD